MNRHITLNRATSSRNGGRNHLGTPGEIKIGIVGDIIADSRATSPGIRRAPLAPRRFMSRRQRWSAQNFFNHLLKRIGAENFPPVLLAEAALLLGAHRAGRQLGHFLDIAAGHRRRVEEHNAGGVAAGVLPGVRHCARHERTGSGPADGDLVADLERHLAGNDPSDLVAFVMQVVEAPRTRRQRLLEQHDAVAGLPAKKLQVKEIGRAHV